MSGNILWRFHKKARNAFTAWVERTSRFWGGWSGFFESFMMTATFLGALFSWAYAMAYLKNRPEELARPPRMPDKQQERDDNRKKTPATVFVIPVCNDEKSSITSSTNENKKDESAYVFLDDRIQLGVCPGNFYHPSVSGAVERKD